MKNTGTRRSSKAASLIALAMLWAGLAGVTDSTRAAGEIPEWLERLTISGLVFGDAYGVVSSHDDAIEGENGFWFRRIYLTFDMEVDDDVDFRLRFEGNSPGDFISDDNIEPFVKDAYLKWKLKNKDVYIGLSSTPTFTAFESFWGYRPVEKTPLDLQRIGSSRDTGVALKGRFNESGRFRYHVMLSNGSGVRGETSEGKKVMAALSFHPSDELFFEIYADTENRDGDTDRSTYQVSAGHSGERWRVGALYSRQHRETGTGTDLDLDIASVFGVLEVKEKITLLARVDRMFDPNPDGDRIAFIPFDPTARSTLVLLGVDFAVRERLSLIPNIEVVFYDTPGGGPDPDDDLIARITLSATF